MYNVQDAIDLNVTIISGSVLLYSTVLLPDLPHKLFQTEHMPLQIPILMIRVALLIMCNPHVELKNTYM